MRKKSNIVVGLTTFNNEMLRISVPALGKLRQKFMLIIHNDNPMTTVNRRQIRRLGYCGDLHIINASESVGLMRARMNIVRAAYDIMAPDWFVFCDDDDMLINLDIPDVSDDNYAIIQNALIIRHRVCDLIRAIENPNDIIPDGENIELARPNIGLVGNPIRADILHKMCNVLDSIMDAIQQSDTNIDYCPPVDAIMWSFVNIYAKHKNPNAVPIYMNDIGYIKTEIDTARIKYNRLARPARNVQEQYRRIIAKYDAVFSAALNAAALRG